MLPDGWKVRLTITQAIQQIHLLSQGNTDYPSSGEDDFNLYIALVNSAISMWENQDGVDWNELFDTDVGTIVSGTPTYNLSADFKIPATQLRLYSSASSTPVLYNYAAPNEIFLTEGLSGNRFTVTGVHGSKVLTLYPTPGDAENGQTYKLGHYRAATTYATGAETTAIDMRDPYFAIHSAIAQLMLEDNATVAGVHQQIANQKLISMRIANDAKPIGSFEETNDLSDGFGI